MEPQVGAAASAIAVADFSFGLFLLEQTLSLNL